MKEFLGKLTNTEFYNWPLSFNEVSQLFNNKITPDELRAKHSIEKTKNA